MEKSWWFLLLLIPLFEGRTAETGPESCHEALRYYATSPMNRGILSFDEFFSRGGDLRRELLAMATSRTINAQSPGVSVHPYRLGNQTWAALRDRAENVPGWPTVETKKGAIALFFPATLVNRNNAKLTIDDSLLSYLEQNVNAFDAAEIRPVVNAILSQIEAILEGQSLRTYDEAVAGIEFRAGIPYFVVAVPLISRRFSRVLGGQSFLPFASSG